MSDIGKDLADAILGMAPSTLPTPAVDEILIAIGCNKKIIVVTGIDKYAKAADALRMIALALDQARERDDGKFPNALTRDADGHLEAEYEDRHGVPDE